MGGAQRSPAPGSRRIIAGPSADNRSWPKGLGQDDRCRAVPRSSYSAILVAVRRPRTLSFHSAIGHRLVWLRSGRAASLQCSDPPYRGQREKARNPFVTTPDGTVRSAVIGSSLTAPTAAYRMSNRRRLTSTSVLPPGTCDSPAQRRNPPILPYVAVASGTRYAPGTSAEGGARRRMRATYLRRQLDRLAMMLLARSIRSWPSAAVSVPDWT